MGGVRGFDIFCMAVLWEGPGIGRRALGPGDLLREVSADVPSITLTPAKGADDPEDNLIEIRPKIDPQGHAVKRVEYFCGTLLLCTVARRGSSTRP